jgi:hypothetical protein
MRVLFEVEHLKVASPATVSRCGMVWARAVALRGLLYVHNWTHSRCYDAKVAHPAFIHHVINEWFQTCISVTVYFLYTTVGTLRNAHPSRQGALRNAHSRQAVGVR